MTNYPKDIPTDSITSILSILKTRDIAAHKGQFGLDVWNLQGYMMGKYLTDPPQAFEALGDHDAVINHIEQHAGHTLNYMILMPVLKFCLQQLVDML